MDIDTADVCTVEMAGKVSHRPAAPVRVGHRRVPTAPGSIACASAPTCARQRPSLIGLTAPNGAGGRYVATEVDSASPQLSDVTTHVVSTFFNGMQWQIQDPLGASGTLPGLFDNMTMLEENTTPLSLKTSTRPAP